MKNVARGGKESDKQKAKDKKLHAFTSDVESVKVASFVKASAFYYTTKLVVHKFTMYNLDTKQVKCFWFDKTAANLEASIFAYCVVSKIEEILLNDPKPVVLWSDGCGPQNRNSTFSNALLNLAVKMGVVIEQKFLLKGHTQMECDSVHSNIEEKLKNREIYLHSQYHSITKEARKIPFPYESEILNYSFFKNFSKPYTMANSSIGPGRVAGDPTVHDLKAIRYNTRGTIDTKIDFRQPYAPLPRSAEKGTSSTSMRTQEFPSLFSAKRPIPMSKRRVSQSLKHVLPEDCHAFYDTLPKL